MYTGFICGLGTDEFDKSLFPERDMEIIFDCEFTTEDFSLVNKLRFGMSKLLTTDSNNYNYSTSRNDLIYYQTKIKECFLKLLKGDRKWKELEFPSVQYAWKLEESNLIVDNSKILENNDSFIYPLHSGIRINCPKELYKKLSDNLKYLADMASHSR